MLGQLIEILEEEADPARVVPHGFANAHSYRGYYHELAVEPAENVTVAEMLATLRGALGATFRGYKGGDYVMDEYTTVYLAHYGATGEQLGPMHLRLMLGQSDATPTKEQDDA